jgi:CO/xanthine dehydrogenase FAD-binding subunit
MAGISETAVSIYDPDADLRVMSPDQARMAASHWRWQSADLEQRLSATRAELAEARAAAERLAQQWEANADRMAPTGKRTNMVDRHTAEILRDRAREVRTALSLPSPRAASEGGEK